MSLQAEWLYYTLHPGGADRLDAVVEGVVAPSAAVARGRDGMRTWFFLRYTDELGPHVRLRFSGAPEAVDDLQPELEATLARALEDVAGGGGHEGWAHALYEPEYEKFGGPDGVATCERVFEASSELALAISRMEAWAPLERRAAGLRIMAETLAAAAPGDARAFWERYAWYWSGADRPGASALRERARRAAARQAPEIAALGARLAADKALRAAVDAYVAVVADAVAELGRAGHSAPDRYAFHFVHLMNNRLGIAILEEAFLAAVLAQR